MTMLWLYLHFPRLQLDTLFIDEHMDPKAPSSAQPIVVFDDKRHEVLQLNTLAQEQGIQTGMGLATASALCQTLRVVNYQESIEIRRLKTLAQALYLKTSDISFFPPNGILLRVQYMLNLYGGLAPYWQSIQSLLANYHITYWYSTGVSPLSARILAKQQWNTVTEDHQQIYAALKASTLEYCDFSAKQRLQLQRVGLCDLGDLLGLPLKEIAQRFDIDLLTYIGRMKGELHHPINYFQPKVTFSRDIELLYEVNTSLRLLPAINKLLVELEHFLKLRDLVTQTLHIRCLQRDTTAKKVTIHAAEGEYHRKVWYDLIALKLEGLTLDAPVHAITLTTGPMTSFHAASEDLFSTQRQVSPISQLVAVLQAKLGDEQVKTLSFNDDHRPECAQQLSPLALAHKREPHDISSLAQVHALRPTFLLTPPQRLTQKVTIMHGPERLISGWWDDNNVTRDYFVARNGSGQLLWVFRTLRQRWYLHGLFA